LEGTLLIRQYERGRRQLEGNKSMATDQFQCKRCGKRECTYYELQIRFADEPYDNLYSVCKLRKTLEGTINPVKEKWPAEIRLMLI
jgi:hypothetical protein